MCLECGFYNGRQIVDMAAKKKAREERLQAKRDLREAQQAEAAGLAEPAPDTQPDTTATETETKEDEKADKK